MGTREKTNDRAAESARSFARIIDKYIDLFPTRGVNAVETAPKEKERMSEVSYRHERTALTEGMWAASHDHEKALSKHFHMEDERPVTPKKIVEAIKEGKWTYVDEKTNDDEGEWDGWMNPLRGIRFSPPADKLGHKNAMKKFMAARADITVAINALTPDKGFEALSKFKKETFIH